MFIPDLRLVFNDTEWNKDLNKCSLRFFFKNVCQLQWNICLNSSGSSVNSCIILYAYIKHLSHWSLWHTLPLQNCWVRCYHVPPFSLSPLLKITAPTGELADWDTHPHLSHVSKKSEAFSLNCWLRHPSSKL